MHSSAEHRDTNKDTLVVGPVAVVGLGSCVAELLFQFKPEWRTVSPLLESLHTIGPSVAVATALNWPLLTTERCRWFAKLRQRIGRTAMAGEVGLVSSFAVNAIYDTSYGQKHVAKWLEATFPFLPEYDAPSARDLTIGMLVATVTSVYMGWQYNRCNRINRAGSGSAWTE